MIAINSQDFLEREEWIAQLTQAAHRTVLERGYRGSFLDLELSLWREIRQTVEQTLLPNVSIDLSRASAAVESA